jgi:hypothetical protein
MNGPYHQLKSQKKIDIYTRDNGKDGQSVLGIGEIPFSLDDITEILMDETQRKGFDDMFDKGDILNEYDHKTFVIHIMFKRILILSPRDFLCMGCYVPFKNGMRVFPTLSFDREDRPETSKYIRGQLYSGGWVLIPIDEKNTKVFYYNRADMKGTIPAFIMKQGASMQATLIAKLRDYMIKKEKKSKK